jgi:hypothetical protein
VSDQRNYKKLDQKETSMPISDADFAALSARVQKVENAISGSLSLNSVAVHNNKGQFTGSFNAGDDKNAASLFLANPTGQNQIHIDGAGVVGADDAHGNRTVNIDGNAGRISTQTLEAVLTGTHVLQVRGAPGAGGGSIQVTHEDNTVGVTITADDIQLANGDIAEQFLIDLSPECFEPGTVVVLCDDRRIEPSSEAYDKRVGGVVAGAGSYHPGLVLDRSTQVPAVAVSCLGKAYCKADATGAPIEVGDLLTSSPNPGYAMRAIDPQRAFGSVIGKALRPLPKGKDLIPILICLG